MNDPVITVQITRSNVARILAATALPAGAVVIGWARRSFDTLREPLVRLASGQYVTMLAGSIRTLNQRVIREAVQQSAARIADDKQTA